MAFHNAFISLSSILPQTNTFGMLRCPWLALLLASLTVALLAAFSPELMNVAVYNLSNAVNRSDRLVFFSKLDVTTLDF